MNNGNNTSEVDHVQGISRSAGYYYCTSWLPFSDIIKPMNISVPDTWVSLSTSPLICEQAKSKENQNLLVFTQVILMLALLVTVASYAHRKALTIMTRARKRTMSSTDLITVVSSDDEDDFEDAVEEQTEQFTVVISPAQPHHKGHMWVTSYLSYTHEWLPIVLQSAYYSGSALWGLSIRQWVTFM